MESQQTRLLTVLSVVVLAIVAFLVFVKPPEPQGADEHAVAWSRAFADASSDAATKVELKVGERTLVFEQTDGAWTVAEAGGAPLAADRQKVRSLLDNVLTVETSPPVSGGDGRLADFGLDTPVAVVTVTAGEAHTLRVGRDTPVGYSTYVQLAEGGPVMRSRSKLSGAVLGGADGALSDFRDRSLVRWNPADLTALRIERGAEQIQLSKDAHGWWLEGQPRQRADEVGLESMLAALTRLQAEGFTPDMGGLETPDIKLTATVSGADQVIEISEEDSGVRLVRAPGVPDLARVQGALHEGFTQDAASWLDDRLMPVRGGELTAVEAKLGDGALSATRTGDGWSKPEAESLLAAIGAVRVDRHSVAEAPQGDPWGALTLSSGDTAREEIKIYQYSSEGSRVAQDSAGGAPFLLPAAELRRLTDALTAAPPAAEPGDAGAMPDMEMLKALQGMGGGER